MPQEGLWEASRQRRTFLMAVDMLVLAAGVLVLVAALIPSSYPNLTARLPALAGGGVLVAMAMLAWRLLIRSGQKVGAVYGMKGARRAGLLPDERPPHPPATP